MRIIAQFVVALQIDAAGKHIAERSGHDKVLLNRGPQLVGDRLGLIDAVEVLLSDRTAHPRSSRILHASTFEKQTYGYLDISPDGASSVSKSIVCGFRCTMRISLIVLRPVWIRRSNRIDMSPVT